MLCNDLNAAMYRFIHRRLGVGFRQTCVDMAIECFVYVFLSVIFPVRFTIVCVRTLLDVRAYPWLGARSDLSLSDMDQLMVMHCLALDTCRYSGLACACVSERSMTSHRQSQCKMIRINWLFIY